MTTRNSVDKILQSFPLQDVAPIVSEPIYDTINELHWLLKANASSVQTTLGIGALGHLALVLNEADYNAISPLDPFVAPPNPGPQEAAAGTAAQIATTDRQHTEAKCMFDLYENTDKALKQQLLGGINNIYVKALANRNTVYAAVTTIQMLQHLNRVHTRITS
jgi:hypothetical protein